MNSQFCKKTVLCSLAILVLAGAATAGIAEDLETLKSAANALATGGTLSTKQTRAANNVVKAVDKAVAQAENAAKYMKKSATVLKKVEVAGKKDVDLSAQGKALLGSMGDAVNGDAGFRSTAVAGRDLLFTEKNKTKVEKIIGRGDKKVEKAGAATTDAKTGKFHAAAAKQFIKASSKAAALFSKEVKSGVARMDVVRTSLEETTELDPGAVIAVKMSLPLDPVGFPRDAVLVVSKQAPEVPIDFGDFQFGPEPEDFSVVLFPDRVTPGDYTLVLLGKKGAEGPFLVSDKAIPLQETVRLDFTIRE